MARKRKAELELQIESLAFGGDGVAKIDGMVVFVPGTLPGQHVRVRLQRKKKSFARARLLEILSPSPQEISPRCRHFEDCGGCLMQNFRYEKQLEVKAAQVRETLEHLGRFENPPIEPILPSPDIFFYRNKMEFTFGDQRWLSRAEVRSGKPITDREFALGLHVRGRYDKILQIDTCHLQSELSNRIRQFVFQKTRESTLRPYTTRDHSGFWRFLVIREGKNTGQVLVTIVTTDGGLGGEQAVAKLARDLHAAFPEINSIVHAINRQKAQVAIGQEYRVLHGEGWIVEQIGRWRFRVSAASFFQTNTRGAELLYGKVAEFAALTGVETVFDLYCGAGTIGIFLSEQAKEIVGIEIVPEAVRDAQFNAALNGVSNCRYVCDDLKEVLESNAPGSGSLPQPDVVIFDPPRAGLHPAVVRQTAGISAAKIVYVSCNPTTFARDARLLIDAGYRLERVQPVDMFPHTAHIELVSLLTKPKAHRI